MTPDALLTDRPGREELGRVLTRSGALSPDWAPTFAAVDRAVFLPPLMWPYDMTTRASASADRRKDPGAWYEGVE